MTTLAKAHSESACYYGERPDWLIVLTRCRDSEILSNSNFESALSALGGESEYVGVERSSHWAVGWVEYLVIDPSQAELVKQAEGIQSQLEDYPIFDESDFLEREFNCYLESWDSWGRDEYKKDAVKALATHYVGRMSEVWTNDEILDAARELEDNVIDNIARETHSELNWEYQGEGDGVTINIEGMVKHTDFDKLSDLAIEALWANQRSEDIKRLGAIVGACPAEVNQALRMGIDLVTGYQALMQGSI